MMSCRLDLVALCILSIVAGTILTVVSKTMYEFTTPSGDSFNAPLTQAAFVAIAMSSNLLFAGAEWIATRRKNRLREHMLSGGAAQLLAPSSGDRPMAGIDAQLPPPPPPPRRCAVSCAGILLLALCDGTTTLSLVFALYLAPASVVQIIDSAGIVFVAFGARFCLGTRHTRRQWLGVAAACLGLICVGASVAISDESSVSSKLATGSSALRRNAGGAALALFATAVSAGQWVLEERFLRIEHRFTPLQQVGLEGSIEALVLICIVLPLADVSGVEDVAASLRTVASSPTLVAATLLLVAALAVYNPISQSVAMLSGSTLRVFMSSLRSVFVWCAGLLLRAFGGDAYGEAWGRGSWLQLVGFALLFCGLIAFEWKATTAQRQLVGVIAREEEAALEAVVEVEVERGVLEAAVKG
tara:strand:- start:2 stop:1243 length:1242 start_codon:yes stop_codon:yes gene_type:complete